MVDVPTVYLGTTQSGKTFRAFQTMAQHPGPAIFWDVQWRAGHYAPQSTRVADVPGAVDLLVRWDGNPPYPRIVIENERYADLDMLVSYLWGVHRRAHVENRTLPLMAVYLDEVSLAADRYADNENPAVRLFTQCYQHRIVGVALTQRSAQISRNILADAWEYYTFTPGRGDLEVYRDFGLLPPDVAWTVQPESHHYYRFTPGRVYRGEADGSETEVAEGAEDEVAEVSEVQDSPQEPVSESGQSGDREADVPQRGDGVPPMRPPLHPGPPEGGNPG
jgi:hypothetical protein